MLILPVGIPIRSTLDNATTVQYAGHIQQLNAKAKTTVRDLDPTNDLTFLRVRTNKHEIMIAPGEREKEGGWEGVHCPQLLTPSIAFEK